MKLRVLARLIQIQRVLVRHGLDEFVTETHLYRPLRFIFLDTILRYRFESNKISNLLNSKRKCLTATIV